jgi:hypothetical protein
MDLMKVSDFCRKYKLPPHRFTRYKYAFALAPKDGFKKLWVKVNQHNIGLVSEIIGHTGTRRRKARLSLEDFCRKYGITDELFSKVCHRMILEDDGGQMMVVDSKHNYALLKHGRLIRKKT